MSNALYVALTVIGGVLAGTQAPINSALSKKVGSFESALISFFVGTIALSTIVIIFGKGSLMSALTVPKWQLVGGLLGTVFVTSTILAVPKIGVASAIFSTILGQILIGIIIDHFGFFGVEKIPLDRYRLLGIVCMLVGLLFIFRSKFYS
ncbi:MAG: DMT family transporter [Desulfitobacterium hafniense]|nr:DMT family transporter [Desulfitobacterium hafniense]